MSSVLTAADLLGDGTHLGKMGLSPEQSHLILALLDAELEAHRGDQRCDLLAAALAKAQAQFTEAGRSREAAVTNAGAKRRYSTLADVQAMIRKPLSDHGLSYVQILRPCVDRTVILLTTRLMHESGQYLESEISLPVPGAGPQDTGKAITYARRYGLMTLLGVCSSDDDDDAEQAQQASRGASRQTPQSNRPGPSSRPSQPPPQPRTPQAPSPASAAPAAPAAPGIPVAAGGAAMPTEELQGHLNALHAAWKAYGGASSRKAVLAHCAAALGREVRELYELTPEEFATVTAGLAPAEVPAEVPAESLELA